VPAATAINARENQTRNEARLVVMMLAAQRKVLSELGSHKPLIARLMRNANPHVES
jgi:hypothetical protein